MTIKFITAVAFTVVLAINYGCSEAKTGAEKATAFAKSETFLTAKTAIETAFKNDGLEHAICFGKDQAGNNIISAMSTGSGHSSSLETVTNMLLISTIILKELHRQAVICMDLLAWLQKTKSTKQDIL
ncbi:MAG TPA: hypothetical protein VF476_02240 [Chitinophagaceae bacterium]